MSNIYSSGKQGSEFGQKEVEGSGADGSFEKDLDAIVPFLEMALLPEWQQWLISNQGVSLSDFTMLWPGVSPDAFAAYMARTIRGGRMMWMYHADRCESYEDTVRVCLDHGHCPPPSEEAWITRDTKCLIERPDGIRVPYCGSSCECYSFPQAETLEVVSVSAFAMEMFYRRNSRSKLCGSQIKSCFSCFLNYVLRWHVPSEISHSITRDELREVWEAIRCDRKWSTTGYYASLMCSVLKPGALTLGASVLHGLSFALLEELWKHAFRDGCFQRGLDWSDCLADLGFWGPLLPIIAAESYRKIQFGPHYAACLAAFLGACVHVGCAMMNFVPAVGVHALYNVFIAGASWVLEFEARLMYCSLDPEQAAIQACASMLGRQKKESARALDWSEYDISKPPPKNKVGNLGRKFKAPPKTQPKKGRERLKHGDLKAAQLEMGVPPLVPVATLFAGFVRSLIQRDLVGAMCSAPMLVECFGLSLDFNPWLAIDCVYQVAGVVFAEPTKAEIEASVHSGVVSLGEFDVPDGDFEIDFNFTTIKDIQKALGAKIVSSKHVLVGSKIAKLSLLPLLYACGLKSDNIDTLFGLFSGALTTFSFVESISDLGIAILEFLEDVLPALVTGDFSRLKLEAPAIIWIKEVDAFAAGSDATYDGLVVFSRDNREALDEYYKSMETRGKLLSINVSKEFAARLAAKSAILHKAYKQRVLQMTMGKLGVTPLGIAFIGESGVGKSRWTDLCSKVFAKRRLRREYRTSDMFVVKGGNFMDGLRSGCPIFLFDDVGSLNPQYSKDVNNATIIQVINPVKTVANMASVEDKGTILFEAQLVMCTSNFANLGADHLYLHPEAYLRRFPYRIRVEVKQEFANNGRLDKSKAVPPLDEAYAPNVHRLFVDRHEGGDYKPYLHFDDDGQFLLWFSHLVDEWFTREDRVLSQRPVETCEHGIAPRRACPACHADDEREAHERAESLAQATVDNPFVADAEMNNVAGRSEVPASVEVANQQLLLARAINLAILNKEQEMDAIFLDEIEAVFGCSSWCELYAKFPWIPEVKSAAVEIDAGTAALTMQFSFMLWVTGLWMVVYDWFAPAMAGIKTSKMLSSLAVLSDFLVNARAAYDAKKKGFQALNTFLYRPLLTGFLAEHFPTVNVARVLLLLAAIKSIKVLMRPALAMLEFERVSVRETDRYPVDKVTGYGVPVAKSVLVNDVDSISTAVLSRIWMAQVEVEGGQVGNLYAYQVFGGIFMTTAHKIPQGATISVRRPEQTYAWSCVVHFGLTAWKHPTKDLLFFDPRAASSVRAKECWFSDEVIDACEVMAIDPARLDWYSSKAALTKVVCETENAVHTALGYAGENGKGNCGLPVLGIVAGNPIFLGVHYMGGAKTCYAVRVTKQDLVDMQALIKGGGHVASLECAGLKGGGKITLYPADKPRLRNHLDKVASQYHGRISFMSNKRSQFYPTEFRQLLLHEFECTPKLPAPLRGRWDPATGEYVDPAWSTSSQVFTNRMQLAPEVLLGTAPVFAEYLRRVLTEYKRLDLYSAIRGLPGVPGFNSMNLSTSAGLGWGGKKSRFMALDPVAADPKFIAEYGRMEALAKRGMNLGVVYECNAKDELLSQAKVEANQHRIFYVADVVDTAIARSALLPIIAQLQGRPLITGIGVGTNCMGPQWSEVAHELGKCERLWCADAQKWDVSLSVLPEISRLLLARVRELGVEGDDYNVLFSVLSSLCTYHATFLGDCYTVSRGMPSGHPFTATGNSLAHIYLIIASWVHANPGGTYAAFSSEVFPLVYGDDSVVGVRSGNLSPQHLVEIFAGSGITLTRDDKKPGPIETVPLARASFLKRGFKAVGDGVFLAPLEKDSILKSLQYLRMGVETATMLSMVADNALKEASLHGAEFFNKLRAFLEPRVRGPLRTFEETYRDALESARGGREFVTWDSDVRANLPIGGGNYVDEE